MKSLSWIGVLVKIASIEERQAVIVTGKMRWNPVEDHANSVLMQVVDEEHEILRRAVATSGSKVSRRLISPGTVKRMLHHRQELHMSESHVLNVITEPVRKLAIVERTVVFLRHAHPRAEMQLVNRDWLVECVPLAPRTHPLQISPVVIQFPNY